MVSDVSRTPPGEGTPKNRKLVTSKVVGLMLLYSTIWVTLCLAIWLVPPVFTGAGFALYTVFWVGFGPPFAMLAVAAVLGVLWVLERTLPPVAAVSIASIVGWLVTLGAWRLLGASTFDATGSALSIAAALVGMVISVAVAWPSRDRLGSAG